MSPETPPSVVILAGGRSRRLGREKPFVDIGGKTVLERLLEAASDARDIVLAVREPSRFASALARWGWGEGPPFVRDGRRVRLVTDPRPDLGPVAGLASGLAAAEGARAVVLAGDLPFVTPRLVDRLDRALREAGDAQAAVPRLDGRDQPLCAAYRRTVAARASRLLDAEAPGGVSMSRLLEGLRVRRLDPAALDDVEDLATRVRGIDTP
ncbi:MAG: molybdenum cofactor guanylyltransferase, partial [Gemmatimonadota bacterium]|nr:molybdenum cofactor guanylyltransferase [Gemmatimonadota bacterium]